MGGMEGVISLSNCVVRASLSRLLEAKKEGRVTGGRWSKRCHYAFALTPSLVQSAIIKRDQASEYVCVQYACVSSVHA